MLCRWGTKKADCARSLQSVAPRLPTAVKARKEAEAPLHAASTKYQDVRLHICERDVDGFFELRLHGPQSVWGAEPQSCVPWLENLAFES